MNFEWDDTKSDICFNDRGFDFAYAIQAFFDPNRIVRADTRTNYGEARYSLPSVELSSSTEVVMERLEALRGKGIDEQEWQKSYNKYQQQYIRKRLNAIKYLWEGESRKEVMERVGCARESLSRWIDMYLEGGLTLLTTFVKSERVQRLSLEQKQAIKVMLLEQRPTDYGIDRQIWTGKNIIEVIHKRWGVELKDSRIYDILAEMGLSHQKAHRDYENGNSEEQKEFVETVKKN